MPQLKLDENPDENQRLIDKINSSQKEARVVGNAHAVAIEKYNKLCEAFIDPIVEKSTQELESLNLALRLFGKDGGSSEDRIELMALLLPQNAEKLNQIISRCYEYCSFDHFRNEVDANGSISNARINEMLNAAHYSLKMINGETKRPDYDMQMQHLSMAQAYSDIKKLNNIALESKSRASKLDQEILFILRQQNPDSLIFSNIKNANQASSVIDEISKSNLDKFDKKLSTMLNERRCLTDLCLDVDEIKNKIFSLKKNEDPSAILKELSEKSVLYSTFNKLHQVVDVTKQCLNFIEKEIFSEIREKSPNSQILANIRNEEQKNIVMEELSQSRSKQFSKKISDMLEKRQALFELYGIACDNKKGISLPVSSRESELLNRSWLMKINNFSITYADHLTVLSSKSGSYFQKLIGKLAQLLGLENKTNKLNAVGDHFKTNINHVLYGNSANRKRPLETTQTESAVPPEKKPRR